jgi:hypothetical protein
VVDPDGPGPMTPQTITPTPSIVPTTAPLGPVPTTTVPPR